MTRLDRWLSEKDQQRLRTALAVLATVGLVHVTQADRTGDPGRPTLDRGEQLGRAYAPAVLKTYADAWDAAAAALAEGKTVAQSQALLQETWKRERSRAFNEGARPEFLELLPEGQEPADPQERARVVSFWKSFAKGMRAASASRTPVSRVNHRRPLHPPRVDLEFPAPE